MEIWLVAVLTLALLILLPIAVRDRARRSRGIPPGRPGNGPPTAGDREPRKPLIPSGAASATADEPYA